MFPSKLEMLRNICKDEIDATRRLKTLKFGDVTHMKYIKKQVDLFVPLYYFYFILLLEMKSHYIPVETLIIPSEWIKFYKNNRMGFL